VIEMGCESCRKLREEEKRMNEMLKAKKNDNVKKEDSEHTHLWEIVNKKKVKRVNYE
jgi:ornithine cyclodeaminase/alanine dehydrogenase-like protein (mu-crystallin family)